jgi:hypothetical protein
MGILIGTAQHFRRLRDSNSRHSGRPDIANAPGGREAPAAAADMPSLAAHSGHLRHHGGSWEVLDGTHE